MHHVVRGPYYRARPNPATPVRRVPFGCSDIQRNISHTEASYVAADPLSIDHRTVPKPVVAHRTFHGKFAGVPVYDHENELALLHRSTPETEICFPSRRHPCDAARGPVLLNPSPAPPRLRRNRAAVDRFLSLMWSFSIAS